MKISLARHLARPSAAQGRQRGYTLIELSIALAIISVIIVGSLIGVQRILANNRANNLLSEFPRINAALVGASSNASTLANITTYQAAALGAFNPATVTIDQSNSTATVTNAFGGNIIIRGNTATFDGVSRGYIVTATQIPPEMCATVANGLAPLAQAIWADSTSVETQNTALPSSLIKGPAVSTPIDMTQLTSQCLGGTGNNAAATRVIHAFIAI